MNLQSAANSGKQVRHRTLAVSAAVSLLLHVLLLVFAVSTHEPAPVHRLHVRPLTPSERIEPFAATRPQMPATEMDMLKSTGPSSIPEDQTLPDRPLARLPGFALPRSIGVDTTVIGKGKAERFRADSLEIPDFEALRRRLEERERYARIELPDSDTTDAESLNRAAARRVVERAIVAIGGWEPLLAITEMRVKVWLETNEHVIPGTAIVRTVLPYLYPLSVQRHSGFDAVESRPVRVSISLDPAVPNERYRLLNPDFAKTKYYRLYDSRWTFLPAQKLREDGEAARWHFVDRFLGEGVVLNHLGTQLFERRSVEVVQVNDKKYGALFRAFFDVKTGLLNGVREGLTLKEQLWFRLNIIPPRTPPRWLTSFKRYEEIDGVLTPHEERRWLASRPGYTVTTQMVIAYNGDELEESAPDLEEFGIYP